MRGRVIDAAAVFGVFVEGASMGGIVGTSILVFVRI